MKFYVLIAIYLIAVTQNSLAQPLVASNTISNPEPIVNTFTDYIQIYQKFISSIRGSTCPMYPSCSNYGLRAFTETNPFSAFILTSDRLLRCGHEHKFYNLTMYNANYKFVDFPVNFDSSVLVSDSKQLFPYSNYSDKSYKKLEFVKYLIGKSLYREALIEIHKLIYNKEDVNQVELYANYIRCLRALNDLEKIIFEYETSFPDKIVNEQSILIEISQVWIDLGSHYNAKKHLNYSRQYLKDKDYLAASYLLEGIVNTKDFNWDEALNSFGKIPINSIYSERGKSNQEIINRAINAKYKSPFWGGILGIIPGAGYFYADHKQTALSALVLNSLFMYATYTTFNSGNLGLGILTSVFSVSFYIGNIAGSVKSVKRRNNSIRTNYVNSIIRTSHIY